MPGRDVTVLCQQWDRQWHGPGDTDGWAGTVLLCLSPRKPAPPASHTPKSQGNSGEWKSHQENLFKVIAHCHAAKEKCVPQPSRWLYALQRAACELPALPSTSEWHGSTITKPNPAFVLPAFPSCLPILDRDGDKGSLERSTAGQPLPSRDTRGTGCPGDEDAQGRRLPRGWARSQTQIPHWWLMSTMGFPLISPHRLLPSLPTRGCSGIQECFAAGGSAIIHTLNTFSILNLSPHAFLPVAS